MATERTNEFLEVTVRGAQDSTFIDFMIEKLNIPSEDDAYRCTGYVLGKSETIFQYRRKD